MSQRNVLLLLSIAACGSVEPAPSTDAAPEPDATPPVPMIQDVLADSCGAYDPPGGVAPGDDLHEIVLDHPDAVCNDGTPAVMYVRPSVGGADADRWVFYLQGGHACGTFEDCAIRYCGTEKYTKAKMSSRWTPAAMNGDGQGLIDRDGTNPFGDANLVLLYYCSSDSWMGTKSDTVLVSEDDPPLQYRLHFRGHTIIEAALDQLLAGGVTSDDGAVTMPSLADAELVMWAGTSAGGNGAEQNVDYVASRLAANGTEVRGVFDANLPPQPSDLGDATAEALVTAADRDVRWPHYVESYGAFVDESCLAEHAGEEWRCGANEHVVLDHVTTPYFVRQDLRDRVIGARYLNGGATEAQLAHAYRATAVRVQPPNGLYVPNCGQHVALTNDDFFEVSTVEGVTLRGALAAWFLGNTVAHVDTQPSSVSFCPAEVDTGE
jgi:hypothetical protein